MLRAGSYSILHCAAIVAIQKYRMDQYPLTASEMVTTALLEIGKTIPIWGAIPSTFQTVFGEIEMNRIRSLLLELTKRLEALEKRTGLVVRFEEKAHAVLLFGAEQVKSDLLAEEKAKEYGGVVAHYSTQPAEMNEVFEVLDCLRKLSAADLKILYRFYSNGTVYPGGMHMHTLVDYQMHAFPGAETHAIGRMIKIYPSLMRLEGLGVLYLAEVRQGGAMPVLGSRTEWQETLRKSATLTEIGERLIRALPH